MPSDYDALKSKLEAHGQAHLLYFRDRLTDSERNSLIADIAEINVEESLEHFQQAMLAESQNDTKPLDSSMEPVPQDICGSASESSPEELESLENRGLRLMAEGKVATLLLAGGQGTRLGVVYPKGMYDIGLPSHKSLYQLQAERILRLQILAEELTGQKATIPWYIMTSEHTREPTIQFLSDRNYFGLDPMQVLVFEQGMMVCFSPEGKILLETPSRLARAPDGNGGLFRALRDSGIIDDMEKRGLVYVHVYGVDNVLVRPADPIFVGYCDEKGAECAAKVVHKALPREAVGVICLVDGKYNVVEYSELTTEKAEQRGPDGRLTYCLGSICNHIFSVPFLKRISGSKKDGLKYHIARKSIPVADPDTGESKAPSKPNGIKIEKFVFDAFPLAKTFACWEVRREDEFSPLKNRPGESADTPKTARQALLSFHQRLIAAQGGIIVDEDGHPISPEDAIVEISPLVSYRGEGLTPLVEGQRLRSPLQLNPTVNHSKKLADSDLFLPPEETVH
ncbi:UDP-N-acetylhexosamine pyrophosphorylase-like protein 1 [Neocloeon triangulifer]|uniref:UDP-N-acetylhexosamine pyrophosphorylase-like protein 1 n=1 Tax=Neocloeon triangulifer TaxID=2078957 RepID=UPI00286EC38C|nr:UDP-N-acetylhexosamine pyrophosphorylase-like protein 1 [Neocloeon triangulifer]